MAELFQNVETGSTAFDGCPDPTAGKSAIVWQGMQSRICHTMVLPDGTPLGLAAYRDLVGSTVKFRRPGCRGKVHTISLTADNFVDADGGKLCFDLPPEVDGTPGIYAAQLVIVDDQARPYAGDSLLVSVEPTALAETAVPGPLTMGEIRRALRDYPALNTAWDAAEFSNEEILQAVIRPVRQFNETLPRVLSYNLDRFPYREEWLRATVSYLLEMGAHWYARNAKTLKYGDGMTEDDKDKVALYAQVAHNGIARFNNFCVTEQVAANMSGHSSLGGTVH